jgi:hypothetical protein
VFSRFLLGVGIQLPNKGGDVILARSRSGGKTLSYATRNASAAAESWGPDQPSNIPDVNANINAGTLPSGRTFLASNACPKNGQGHMRDPLVLSSSADGWKFDRAVYVFGLVWLWWWWWWCGVVVLFFMLAVPTI